MGSDTDDDEEPSRGTKAAASVFEVAETTAYLVLGLLLALATVLSMCSGAASLWSALVSFGEPSRVVATIDRLLFVFMLVEILHTVRVSFRTGVLACEPFLIVGLIASIRRVLVITLKSSAASQGGKTIPQSPEEMKWTLIELTVLGVLILVMVASIFMLRRSEQKRDRSASS